MRAYKRADVLASMSRHEEALADLNRAIRVHPQDAALRYAKGTVLYEMGKPTEAINELSIACDASSNDPRPFELRAEVWRTLGESERADADMSQAESLRSSQ
jgi:predicted Zn-dependent protease